MAQTIQPLEGLDLRPLSFDDCCLVFDTFIFGLIMQGVVPEKSSDSETILKFPNDGKDVEKIVAKAKEMTKIGYDYCIERMAKE